MHWHMIRLIISILFMVLLIELHGRLEWKIPQYWQSLPKPSKLGAVMALSMELDMELYEAVQMMQTAPYTASSQLRYGQ